MSSGTPPNTSIILNTDELAFIDRRYSGSKSAAIHAALAAVMNPKTDEDLAVNPAAEPFMSALRTLVQRRYDLDYLAEALHALRVEQMIEELGSRGITARCQFGEHLPHTNYVLVYAPDGVDPQVGEWATLTECRRLLDIVANLPPAEAFRRWRERIEPWDSSYTRQDAERDTRAERAELRQQYQAGTLDGEMFALMHRQAGEYLDMVDEPVGRSETIDLES